MPDCYLQVIVLPSRFSHVVLKLVYLEEEHYYGFMPDKHSLNEMMDSASIVKGQIICEKDNPYVAQSTLISAKLVLNPSEINMILNEIYRLQLESPPFYNVAGLWGSWNCLSFIYHIFDKLGYSRKNPPLQIAKFWQLCLISVQSAVRDFSQSIQKLICEKSG